MKWIQAQHRLLKESNNQNLKRLNNLKQLKLPLQFHINQMQSLVSISQLHNSVVNQMQTSRMQNLNMKKRNRTNSFVIRNQPKFRLLKSLLRLLQRHRQKFHRKCHQRLHLRPRHRNLHKLLQRRLQSKKQMQILQRYQFLKRNRKMLKSQCNLQLRLYKKLSKSKQNLLLKPSLMVVCEHLKHLKTKMHLMISCQSRATILGRI